MDVADGPVGIVRQAVDALDRQHGPFERAHAVKGQRHHHHADDRVGADLVPCPVQGHQAVYHAAPARHPQHDRKHHAQRLRPVGQGGIMEVVRTRPDVEKYQRPEVDDRQTVTVYRAFGLLGHEVVHHCQETCRQEEAHGIVSIPPLDQRILHPGIGGIAFRAEQAHRHGQIVDQVQHRHGDDEGEVEPVCDIDVRFAALGQRGHEDDQVRYPDHGQPQVDIPFRLGIFFRLGDTQQVAGSGQHDEQLVAPEHEPGETRIRQLRTAGALDDIEAGCDQRVAAESENHGTGVQGTQAAKVEIGFEVELRKCQLQGDEQTGAKPRQTPEHRRDHAPAHRIVVIFRWTVRHLEKAVEPGAGIEPGGAHPHQDKTDHSDNARVRGKAAVRSGGDHSQ